MKTLLLMTLTGGATATAPFLMDQTQPDVAVYECETHGRCVPAELAEARLAIATLDTLEPEPKTED